MFFKKESVKWFFSVFALIVLVVLTMQACSKTDDFIEYPDSEMKDGSDLMEKRSRMIESVVTSDELVDYEKSCMALAEKLKAYTSTLAIEKYDDLMNNLNNDDYMMDIANKVDLTKELLMIENAKQKLLSNMNFQKLDESDRMTVFVNYFNKSNKLQAKTRSESGDKSECERRRDEDYAYASVAYVTAMAACSCATAGVGVCLCAIAASVAYDYAITLADRAFYDCINGKK